MERVVGDPMGYGRPPDCRMITSSGLGICNRAIEGAVLAELLSYSISSLSTPHSNHSWRLGLMIQTVERCLPIGTIAPKPQETLIVPYATAHGTTAFPIGHRFGTGG
jgi:hypothetical protein